ncbi:hypothetical protein KP17_10225 [Pectobacterium parvum]|nr:hypothetical protein KP17_10225 [Pectobacterium parvum]KHS99903.1 hypothetical protein RC88_01150 [Pectobacterium parvum]
MLEVQNKEWRKTELKQPRKLQGFSDKEHHHIASIYDPHEEGKIATIAKALNRCNDTIKLI